VLNRYELRERLPPEVLDASAGVTLDPRNLPEALRSFIHYAEQMYFSEDTRMDFVDDLDPQVRRDIDDLGENYAQDLESWLAGPESEKLYSTATEYDAFSILWQWFDELQAFVFLRSLVGRSVAWHRKPSVSVAATAGILKPIALAKTRRSAEGPEEGSGVDLGGSESGSRVVQGLPDPPLSDVVGPSASDFKWVQAAAQWVRRP